MPLFHILWETKGCYYKVNDNLSQKLESEKKKKCHVYCWRDHRVLRVPPTSPKSESPKFIHNLHKQLAENLNLHTAPGIMVGWRAIWLQGDSVHWSQLLNPSYLSLKLQTLLIVPFLHSKGSFYLRNEKFFSTVSDRCGHMGLNFTGGQTQAWGMSPRTNKHE